MPTVADLAVQAIEYVKRLSQVANIDELESSFMGLIEPLGLTVAACGVVSGPMLAAGRRFFFLNWPEDWVRQYEAENFAPIDPVPRWVQARGARTTFQDLVLGLNARDPGRRVIEAGLSYSFAEGMLIPIAMSDGSLGIVSVAGDRDRLDSSERAFLEIVATATLRRADELAHARRPEGLTRGLTRRELDCLALLVRGLGDRDIATKLAISEPTVRFHLDSARRKTGALSRTHLAAMAVWLGFARL